jgi:hypothetical protein
LNLADRLKLPLVPIPGMIERAEATKLRRKTARLGRIVMPVSAAQESTSEGIEWNHGDSIFLGQWEKFALALPEQKVVTRLD